MKHLFALLDWWKAQAALTFRPSRNLIFHEREIWWCSIGFNVGEEEFGKGPRFARPVLIFKKFTASSFFGIPLTGTIKAGSWYFPISILKRPSSLMLNQGRVLDGRRLIRSAGKVGADEFRTIQKRFRELYCP